MVTARKIRCLVVVADSEASHMARPTQPRFRPSDLLPWADPHIRSLVEQLQEEVREEASLYNSLADDSQSDELGFPSEFESFGHGRRF